MRPFIPDPPMRAWLEWVEAILAQPSWYNTPLSTGQLGIPRGARLVPPPLPPEPADPPQRAFYYTVLWPINEAINVFNARAAASEVAEDTAAQLFWQQQSSNAP